MQPKRAWRERAYQVHLSFAKVLPGAAVGNLVAMYALGTPPLFTMAFALLGIVVLLSLRLYPEHFEL